MRIFDGHSDILTDVTMRRLEGNKNVFNTQHLKKLQDGGVEATILVNWIDPPFTNDSTWRMLQILGATFEEIDNIKDVAGIVYNFSDFEKLKQQQKIQIVLGMEGLSGLRGSTSLINVLYRLGIRHASLTWNEENEFATGVGSENYERGVTDKGRELLQRMECLGMVVDVSHGNEKTFWDIYKNTSKPFIASHSNAYSLCKVKRNLKDDQIKAIAERGGVIGMNSWPDFIHETDPSVENLASHIDYITELVGVDYISLGFDFCDFLAEDTTSSFQGGRTTSALGLENASKIPNLIRILKQKGYSDGEIQKIAYGNLERVLKQILIY